MKKSILFFLFLFFQFSFGQNRFYFYVELSSNEIAPSVINKNDGTKEIHFNDERINTIFNKYVIYKFERLVENALSENLKKTFSVETNDVNLINEIVSEFGNIFVMTEQYFLPFNGGILYTPNDYNTYQPQVNYEPKHLDMIRAQQAWDITTGNSNVKIGISDTSILNTHEEFVNKNVTIIGNNNSTYPNASHGTGVSGLAAGDTNNGVGLSSIGFNTGLMFTSGVGWVPSLLTLGNNGAKVVNGSWYSAINKDGGIASQTEQNIINDLHNMNVVVVIASGNGPQSGFPPAVIDAESYSNRYYYPASYKNVISVSTVGNWNEIGSTVSPFDHWKDVHKVKTPINAFYNGTSIPITETEIFHQHNDSIDIVVPAYKVPVVGSWQNNGYWYSADQGGISGTSFSAPIVTGTVGLIFSVNYCLKPKEVESILKLTARNIEDLPENIQFHGKLGGGALDAFKAVEMANEMAKPFGTVNVVDRILYRNWFYKLETAPYEIKMSNNIVTDGAKIKFFAKNNIEITSGDYKPDIGYVDLQINPSLSLNCTIPSNRASTDTKLNEKNQKSTEVKLYPNPNTGVFTVTVSQKEVKDLNIELFDVFGKSVYKTVTNNSNTEIDIQNLADGIYLVRLTSPEINEILKLIKN